MIVLDTHVVIWLASLPDKLTSKASRAIQDTRQSGGGLAISAVTLYEVAFLASRHRIQLWGSPEDVLAQLDGHFIIKPITSRICAEMMRLPEQFPRDPLDRIIAATAIVEGATLVTADVAIQESNAVRTLW